MKLSEQLKKIADDAKTNSFVSHCTDGATVIYIGANERDVMGQLMLAALEIEKKRADTVGKK